MKKIATVFVLALLPACVPLGAEELREGTWKGVMKPGQGNRTLPADLVVKKVQDPHWRWRPDGGEVLSVTQAGQPVSDLRLENGTLSYSVNLTSGPIDARVRCALERQEDGTFAGSCRGDDEQRLNVTLSPPSETPAG